MFQVSITKIIFTMRLLTFSIFFFICTSYSLISQCVINIPNDYQTIQEGLDVANIADTILIAPGTYFENISWPSTDSLVMIGAEGSDQTIIDGNNDGFVIYQGYLKKTLTIKGLTIQHGRTKSLGAGLAIIRNSVELSDLKIRNNKIIDDESNGRTGAGLSLIGCSGSIFDSEITGNHIDNTPTPGGVTPGISLPGGAGMYLFIKDYLGDCNKFEISNVLFSNNSTGLECVGGGLLVTGLDVGTELNIKNSKFLNNSSPEGSAIYSDTENGGSDDRLAINITNTEISKNKVVSSTGNIGNAIYISNASRSLEMTNCLIAHNEGNWLKNTALVWQTDPLNNLKINHCTFAYNEKGLLGRSSVYDIKNSIFWNNDIDEIEDNSSFGNASIFELSHCVINGGFAFGTEIISEDPQFISENLLLPSEDSPCLNAASPTTLGLDLIGFPRPSPIGSFADIGAYEIDQYFAHFISRFYFDQNRNGLRDSDERFIALGAVEVDGNDVLRNFREEGILYIVDQGDHTVRFSMDSDPNWELTSSQESYLINVDMDDYSTTLEFGIAPINNFSKLSPTITADRFRCGEEVEMKLYIKNAGTEIEEGVVWMSLDNRFEDYSFVISPDVIETDHLVGWYYENLYPHESICFEFKVTAPLVEDVSEIGEIYFLYASSNQNDFDTDESFKLDVELRCAFDPNDKTVFPKREDNLVLKNSLLYYRIRFQNTGNDFARNLNVIDTLDEHLDPSTFKLINTSHPNKLNVIFESSHRIKFDFPNIFLPDSTTNLEGSNGYVNYSIMPYEDAEIETEIENTAFIYFDFNPPIITNTTNSIIVDQFPFSNIVLQEDELLLNIFPNPTIGMIYFQKKVDIVKVYNMDGKLLIVNFDTKNINLEALQEGFYLMKCELNSRRSIHKVFKIE